MVIFLGKLSYSLNECLTFLKGIEFKGLRDSIIARVIPALNTSSINNVLDPSLVHILEFVNALLVEGLELIIKVVKVFSGQWKSFLHFCWHFSLGF